MSYKLILDPDYVNPNEGELIDSFLVNSDGLILEYARIKTESGINTALAASISLNGASTEQIRDFVVTPDGTLHIYAGTFDPILQSYNWQSPVFQSRSHLGWSTVNNVSYGGIDYFENYVFVTDMKTYGSDADRAQGIIRFSQTNEPVIRFAEQGNFIDLTVGLDNLIYGLESYGKVSVYDPESLELVRSFTLQDKYNNYRGIAVNQQGEIFSAAWDGNVYYFNPEGNIVDVNQANRSGIVDFNTNNFNDINISPDGTELIASDRQGLIALLTIKNQYLELQDVFPTGGNSAFVSFGNSSNITKVNSLPEISISDAEVFEWNQFEPAYLNFTVSLSQAVDEVVEVDVYSFIPWGEEHDNHPENFADYDDVYMTGEMLTFAPGETEKVFSLEVFDDWKLEKDEQIYVEIGHVFSENATIGDRLGIGTIIDDDFMPTVAISDATMLEGNYADFDHVPPRMKFTVSLDAPAYHPVAVDVNTVTYPLTTISDAADIYLDFYPILDWMNLTFEPGETTKIIEIEINPDLEYEANEQFALEISNVYGATIGDGLGIGTILDDDFVPTVAIADTEVLEGDGAESTWMNFTVSLSKAVDEVVEVDAYSFIPWSPNSEPNQNLADYSDFVAKGEKLSFAPGETEKIFSIKILPDFELEADEQISAEIAYVFSDNAIIDRRIAIGTILDNDSRKPQVSISDATAIEGGVLEFKLELDRPAEDDVFVSVTANYQKAGLGWAYGTLYNFVPGETSGTLRINTDNDLSADGDIQFAVEIDYVSDNAILRDAIATGTIIDNDLVLGEVGYAQGVGTQIQQIQFQHQYENPVVLVSPLTRNGTDPAIARITDIQADGFSVFVQEPTLLKQKNHSGHHVLEDFSYMVMEAGSWTMPDGSLIEVGSIEVNSDARAANWESLEFAGDFKDPVVISSVQTYNNEEFIGLRQRNGNENAIDLALEKEEALLTSDYAGETVGYVAVESGQNHLFGSQMGYLAGETGRTVNHQWQQLDDAHNYPYLFASTNSYYGRDSVGLRYQMGSIMLDEETSRDNEIAHTFEDVAYLGFDHLGTITVEI